MAGPRRTKPRSAGPMPEFLRIGRAFADRRVALRLTQQSVADLAGVSRSTVQSLEQGMGSTFGSMLEIAAVLGLHVDVSVVTE